jgi:hypothetical protein
MLGRLIVRIIGVYLERDGGVVRDIGGQKGMTLTVVVYSFVIRLLVGAHITVEFGLREVCERQVIQEDSLKRACARSSIGSLLYT